MFNHGYNCTRRWQISSIVPWERKMRWIAVSFVVSFLVASAGEAAAEKKVALVIGNDAYVSQARLDNPSNDARIIAAELKKIGFNLVGGGALVDLDKVATDRMVDAFGAMAQDADIALFYFSGHGMQIDGTNYLIPVDLGQFSRTNVGLRTLNADLVSKAMSKARLKMLLLDACRTNPFHPDKDVVGGGLAQMQAPAGTIIGFATQPNTTATQGVPGGTSPYAAALALYLKQDGLELFAMLNEVGLKVMAATQNRQQPWISASPITGRVYLNPSIAATPPQPRPIVGYAPEPPSQSQVPVNTGASLGFIQSASLRLNSKDYAGARTILTKGIEVDRNSAVAFSYRGFAWYLDGLARDPSASLEAYRMALPDLDRAIQLDPTYAPARRHRGNTVLAVHNALKALKKPTNDLINNAIDDLKAAVQLDSTKANNNALGEAYLIKGSYDSAIASFNKAIALDPSFAAPYSGLCFAHRMLGQWDSAYKNAQFAASRDDALRTRPCLTRKI
jgi:tetratricopeptide (TPR) repeat protein